MGPDPPAPFWHATVRFAAYNRQALAQLCRYIIRPAVANEPVQANAAGQVVLMLKTPWSDGTTRQFRLSTRVLVVVDNAPVTPRLLPSRRRIATQRLR